MGTRARPHLNAPNEAYNGGFLMALIDNYSKRLIGWYRTTYYNSQFNIFYYTYVGTLNKLACCVWKLSILRRSVKRYYL